MKRALYDPATHKPVLLSSACTGEMTLGLMEIATGRVTELGGAKDERALDALLKSCGIKRAELTKIW